MPNIKFTTDKIVKRLRWLMVFVISVDAAVTLLGQPNSYWSNYQTALEGNPFFYQFLIRGYVPFFLTMLIYAVLMFSVVSVLPRRAALTVIFAYILGHYFGAESWMMFRWKLGGLELFIYSIVLGAAIVALAFPEPTIKASSRTPR